MTVFPPRSAEDIAADEAGDGYRDPRTELRAIPPLAKLYRREDDEPEEEENEQ